MDRFRIQTPLKPAGDQPRAIEALCRGYLDEGRTRQCLLGVTGSGKTITMAHGIDRLNVPT